MGDSTHSSGGRTQEDGRTRGLSAGLSCTEEEGMLVAAEGLTAEEPSGNCRLAACTRFPLTGATASSGTHRLHSTTMRSQKLREPNVCLL